VSEPIRHCEERSDAAIHDGVQALWLWIAAASGLAMTMPIRHCEERKRRGNRDDEMF
jgi:hypothetical protein